jgi:cytochrome c-type biogenesis protein CcmF
MAVMVAGIAVTSMYSSEKDVRLQQGQAYEMSGYSFLFNGVKQVQVANYVAQRGEVVVSKDGEVVTTLYPEKRNYGPGTMPMTEAGIESGFLRDLFIALGEPLGENDWSVRLYHKPLVNWIWMGAALMGLGGLLAAFDRRYRLVRRRVKEPVVTKETDEAKPVAAAGNEVTA